MDDTALGRGHRLELDLLAALERSVGRSVGLPLDRLLAALTVTGRVHHDSLALLKAAKRGSIAQQLHRVDRLAPASDQQAHVLTVDATNDLVRVLVDLDVRLDVEGVDDPFENRPNPLGRLRRQAAVPVTRHPASLVSRRRGQRVELDGFAPALTPPGRPSDGPT